MSLTSYWLRVKEEYGYVLIQTYNLLLNFTQGIVYLIDVMDLLIVTSYKIIFKPWIFKKNTYSMFNTSWITQPVNSNNNKLLPDVSLKQ